MPPSTAHSIRKFRFNRPQQIAAAMLFLLLAQCLWVTKHQTLSETDYQFARCGREMWEKPSPLAGYFTSCGNIHDGTLAYRAAGLPLTIQRIFAGQESSTSTWEMRHEVGNVKLFIRLPFILAGLALGACLWWVTRRLYGNTGGYIALALYCFAPPIVHACTYPNNEILVAFGLFATVYTAIGVAHAMQGPQSKWRPRIILLTLAFGFTAAAHISAFILGLVLAIAFMAYVAEGRRSYLPTLLILWILGGLFLLFASYAFRPDAFSYVFRSEAGKLWFSLSQAGAFFSSLTNAGITIAAVGALGFYLVFRRSRYFGNTTPLLVTSLLLILVTPGVQSEPWLWALPFLLAFIGGVFADVLETRYRKPFLWITSAVVVAEAALCIVGLPLLAQ
ncbi:glycosyltransferase family 39 protein [Acidobacterium sp. S8]|uniref:glycosyltransferase family 39 protein n=1 Tax=Acidobacterium sp. S8 TaxID=1641854 RepID=UPI00131CB5F9|nr:glycosyltransferase family 39 protein [Acidobacterium sp. S8]